MNKIYIVEMYGFDDYKRYGIFAKIEDARKLLQKVFEEEKSFYENIKDPIYELTFIDDNKFVLKFEDRVHENYIIKEEVIL